MSVDDLLNTVEHILPPNRLGAIERFILRQSWSGQTYGQMAQESGYGSEYIKEVGSRLWQDLSDALGERVTKKNLQLVFNHHRGQPDNESQPLSTAKALQILPKPTLPTRKVGVSFPSGPIPLDSPLYIERPPIEALVFAEIQQPGCVIRIKASRQMGKSSLLNRILAYAKTFGYQTVQIDFREADQTIFSSLDRFLRWFCINVSRRLRLEANLDPYWDEEMGSKVSCKIYFSAYLLEQIRDPIVLVLNEVNQLFEHPDITQDFLPMLRFWHEQAKQDPAWQKLRLVLAHTTDVYVPLNINQSPFNVGLAVKLPPFTLEQVQELAQRYDLDWSNHRGREQAALLQACVGGHPYLVNLALYHLCQGDLDMEQLLQSASAPTGIYGNHLRQLLGMLQENSELLSALRQVVMADRQVQLESITAHKLESMGLILFNGAFARPSCELYQSYFCEHLRDDSRLDSEPRSRQEPVAESSSIGTLDQEALDQEALDQGALDQGALDQNNHLSPLIDRHSFHQSLGVLWQAATDRELLLSLLRCEVDYFHLFVESYGSETSESCLRDIIEVIQGCVEHPQALIARYGSAEFAIVLPQANLQDTTATAERIRASVAALGIAHDHARISAQTSIQTSVQTSVQTSAQTSAQLNAQTSAQTNQSPAQVMTVSLGVATTTPTVDSLPESLLAAAERALHQAKRQGRNCVVSTG